MVKRKTHSFSAALVRTLILLVLSLTFLLSLPALYARVVWESQNVRVLVIADFDEFLAMCDSQQFSTSQCAALFSERRIAIALSELTLSQRVARGEASVTRVAGALLISAPPEIEPDLSLAVPPEWRIRGTPPTYQIPAGLPLERVPAGFAIPAAERGQIPASWVLRPLARPYWSRDQILSFSRRMSEEPSVPLLLSAGEEVLGFPFAYREAANGYAMVALPEFSQQRGAEALAAANPEKALRLHTIPPEEWEHYTMETARARFLRAVRERSLRVLYIHPAPTQSLKENLQFVDTLLSDLKKAGYDIAPPSLQAPPENLYAPILLGLSTALLALETGALLMYLGVPLLACLLAALIFTGIVFLAGPAVLGAVTFSLLIGMAFGSARGSALARWLIISTISFISGAVVAAMIQSPALLKGIVAPGGVRLSLMIPPIFAFLFAYHQEPSGWARALKSRAVSLMDAVAATIFLFVAGYALIRAGSAQGWELPLESRLRFLLEQFLPVRPRFKEVLGHPLLIAIPAVSRRGLLLPALLTAVGALAPASILNSFFHLHTPLLLVLQRIGAGFVFGGLFGLLLSALLRRYENPLRRLFW